MGKSPLQRKHGQHKHTSCDYGCEHSTCTHGDRKVVLRSVSLDVGGDYDPKIERMIHRNTARMMEENRAVGM